MSKARARQGSGSRSGAARAGANGKSGRAAGSAGSRTADGRANGGAVNGKRTNGQAQRALASTAKPAGANGAARTATGANDRARRPASATAKAPASQTAKVAAPAPAQGKRWLLGMNGIEASTLILSVIGLGVAVYATILHFDSNIKPFCSASGSINCEAVMTSPQSVVFGIFPVAVLGMAFFLFMVAINSPWAWRAKFPAFLDRFGGRALSSRPEVIGWTRLGSIIVGMGFAIYLIFAELVQVQKICLWCTSVHIITFLLFIIIVFDASFSWGRTEAPRAT